MLGRSANDFAPEALERGLRLLFALLCGAFDPVPLERIVRNFSATQSGTRRAVWS
jgi:hypothetical protein